MPNLEKRPARTKIEIHSQYATIPFKVLKSEWGFIPSKAHLKESPEMRNILRELVSIITQVDTLPPSSKWNSVTFNENCVLIFW